MALRPTAGHIIVRPASVETKTASGIIIPDTAGKERPERGDVIAVGPGRVLENGTREPIELSISDTVLFKKYAPDEVEVDGETLLVIKAEDVIAVIE